MRTYKLFSVLLLVLFIHPFSAQCQREKTKTVKVDGSYVASENETPIYGKAQALWRAKKEALQEAGVTERISSMTIISLGGAGGDDVSEFSSEFGEIELDGRVRVLKQWEKNPELRDDGHIKYSVTIQAEVLLEESEEDVDFQCRVEGIKSNYREGENITFTVTPTKDCYLRVFCLGYGRTPAADAQIYPLNNKLKDVKLTAGVSVKFPPEDQSFLYDGAFEYTATVDNRDADAEKMAIVIVALKKQHPFGQEVTKKNVFDWLWKIPRNERCVATYPVITVKSH